MRQAQKRFPEANQLFRRSVREVTFASNVPESTVSDIWLSAAGYWRTTGRYDVALKILGDLSRLNRNVIAQSDLLLPDDVGRSVAYLALSAQMQAEILQKLKGAEQAAKIWHTERNFFEQIGKLDFLDEKVAVIHLPKDLGVPSSADGFSLLPIPVDPQCFYTRPYRGRILAKDRAGKWTLHPQYRAMRELAKRRVAQH